MKERCYSVSFIVHNKNSGSWASKASWTGTDERAAWAQYGSEISRLMGSSDFDVVTVFIMNDQGYLDSHNWDERPEPEEEITPTIPTP